MAVRLARNLVMDLGFGILRCRYHGSSDRFSFGGNGCSTVPAFIEMRRDDELAGGPSNRRRNVLSDIIIPLFRPPKTELLSDLIVPVERSLITFIHMTLGDAHTNGRH